MIIGGADFCAGVELVGPTKRMMLGVGIVVFWCLGMMMLTPFAYFIRYWKTLQMAVSAMPVSSNIKGRVYHSGMPLVTVF